MTKLLIRALLGIIAVALNIVWPEIRSAAPNFLFLLVVLYAFREGNESYLGFAVFGGVLFDIYSSNAFGSYMLGLLLIGLLLRLATATLFRSEPRSVAYMAVAIISSNILLIAFLYLFSTVALRWSSGALAFSPLYIAHSAWLAIILNLIFAIPLYVIVESVESTITRYSHPRNTIR